MKKTSKHMTRLLALISISVSLAMVLSFTESLLPPLAAVPGIKIGLANIVTVFLLYTLGERYALGVSIVRVFLSALLFGSVMTLAYSLAGALLSFTAMCLLKRCMLFSSVGVSVVGGVMHNIAQIAVACLVMETGGLLYYLPVLLISGVLSGIGVGIIAGLVTSRLSGKIGK